jgi:hypothetical protein
MTTMVSASMGSIPEEGPVKDDDRTGPAARPSNENAQFIASLRRETDISLRDHPERLPWRRTERLETRHGRTSRAAPRDETPARRRDAAGERDERVARALASSGPMRRRELEDELGLLSRDVTTSLYRLRVAGRAAYDGTRVTRWRLTASGERGPTHQ